MRELIRFLLVPVALTVLVVLVFMKPWRNREPERRAGYEQVLLVRKGPLSAVTSLFGGASGSVWYTPSGRSLSLRLSAQHLEPGEHYILEIQADSIIYDVASRAADEDGRIAFDTSLTSFAEGVCVGDQYDPPRVLQPGRAYSIRFWLKRDGNPATGAQRVRATPDGPAVQLPCNGNGDGNYDYVLLENSLAIFRVSDATP